MPKVLYTKAVARLPLRYLGFLVKPIVNTSLLCNLNSMALHIAYVVLMCR